MIAQADALKRLAGARSSFISGNARKRERELHVREHRLVRDQVIALEDKAYAVVAVGIPIAIFVLVGRNTLDNEIARVVVVEATHDVQERRLPRAARTQDGDELVIAKGNRYAIERLLREIPRRVRLANVLELEHDIPHQK